MKPLLLIAAAAALPANAYYTMLAYAPSQPQMHGKVINASDKAFVIGAEDPTTFCDIEPSNQCPPGSSTLVNHELTSLAVCPV